MKEMITDTARARAFQELYKDKIAKAAKKNKLDGEKAEKDKAKRRNKNKLAKKARKAQRG